MVLNKQKGNMYRFVTHTWNTIKGECPHACSYCYMKRFPQGKLRFDEKELGVNLGKGNKIFVGSSCDMFAEGIGDWWIRNTLMHCNEFENEYLFQTKNPKRLRIYRKFFPKNTILGITLETNRNVEVSKADSPRQRVKDFSNDMLREFKKFITIEPIMDFDLEDFVEMIDKIRPKFINIGADSGNNNLLEPEIYKITSLIKILKMSYKVNIKQNLGRLLERKPLNKQKTVY